MAKCDFCSIYDPDSECLAESCLIVKYGIAHKVKNDAAFNAQFGELNDILSIQSIQLLMEIMQTIALATVSAAASSSGLRTTMSLLVWVQGPINVASGSRTNTAFGSTGLKKLWKNTKKILKKRATSLVYVK